MSKFDNDYFDKIERNWAEDAQRRRKDRNAPKRDALGAVAWVAIALVFLALIAIAAPALAPR